MGVRREENGHLPGLEIETNNQNFLENLKSAAQFDFLQWQYICRCDTHTAQEPGLLFWCHAVVSLHFTHVRSFAWSAEAVCQTCERIVLQLAVP